MENRRLGVALFGLGRAGKIHLGNVVKNYGLELLYVVESLPDMAEPYVSQFNQPQCSIVTPDDRPKVLADSRVDFVIVATPTPFHEAIILAALRAGKGVFSEKPIAGTEESVIKCYDEAAACGRPLFCSFNRRFDPSLREVFTQRERVGDMQMVKSCARDSPLPSIEYLRISAGVFHDCLVHDIDLICWIVGDWPIEVYAKAHCFSAAIAELDDVDTVAAVMKFSSGAIAIIDTSRDARYGYDQRIEVFGTNGMLKNENQRPNNLTFEGETGASTGRMYNSFNDRYEQSYINALGQFELVMRGKAELGVTKETTLNVSKIASALEESSRSGKEIMMVY